MSLSPSALLHQPLCWQRCIHGLLLHLHSKILKCTLKSSTSTLYGMQLPHNAILYFTDFCTKRYFCFITPQCREADLFPPLFLNHFFQLLPNVFVDSRLSVQTACVRVCYFFSSPHICLDQLSGISYLYNPSGFLFKVFHLFFCPFLSSIRCQSCLLPACQLSLDTSNSRFYTPPQLNTK